MEEKIVYEGKEYTRVGHFAVTPEADCIYCENGEWATAKQYVSGKKPPRKGYIMVVRNLNSAERTGKGRSRVTVERKYLSRLVATAFVPNPDNLEMVTYKNGNALDCRAENLVWANNSRIKTEYYKNNLEERHQRSKKCQCCGKPLADWNDNTLCTYCKKRLPFILKKETARDAIKKAVKDSDEICNENRFERMDRIKQLRDSGVTLKDIGKIYGLTKQRVCQILKRGEKLAQRKKA